MPWAGRRHLLLLSQTACGHHFDEQLGLTLLRSANSTPSGKLYATTSFRPINRTAIRVFSRARGRAHVDGSGCTRWCHLLDGRRRQAALCVAVRSPTSGRARADPIASVARFDGTTWCSPALGPHRRLRRAGEPGTFVGGSIPRRRLASSTERAGPRCRSAGSTIGSLLDIDEEGGQPVVAGNFVLDESDELIARRVGDAWGTSLAAVSVRPRIRRVRQR